ncbi:response regulator transcription factor [Cohnella fermenti]|uniref:Response regulator n=1 Tax=Cohnella fermenti TaxID=2565925 RepID=A0A4S4BZZ9_9BACL|nr:response regulator [Cohnella fermenti]THF80367.1 response regulator [Cohnella fermenti]
MLKVLIVEDEEIIRKGLVHTYDWLEMGCIVVGEAGDGTEGLRLFEELHPDLVITDIRMPCMNGIEMLERMMEIRPISSIILTSYTEFEYAQQAISLRVTEYLLKPVDEFKLQRIVGRIRREVGQERAREEIMEKTRSSSGGPDLSDLEMFVAADKPVNYYVEQALQRIKSSYATKVSLEFIACELGVSSSYLSRKFREATGHTFHEILSKHRVQRAIELLCGGQYRINEIADMTGFSDYKHFCTVFKKYTSLSPSDVQKSGSWAIVRSQNQGRPSP